MKSSETAIQKIGTVPIDYLVIGHITKDLINSSERLGGTATFSGLTANALGLRTGIITSSSGDIDLSSLEELWINNIISEHTTTFRNISDGISRNQFLYKIASPLTKSDVPEMPSPPKILHLGPVADEVDPNILSCFPQSMKCLTPQGWFRKRDEENRVIMKPWAAYEQVLSLSDAAVISLDDLNKDEVSIAKMAASIPVLAVTENYKGARVYWQNDVRFFSAPEVEYVDDTGAGDIFSAAFFYRYFFTKDPWEAARFAVSIASWSVERMYLESIPTMLEITKAKTEVVGY